MKKFERKIGRKIFFLLVLCGFISAPLFAEGDAESAQTGGGSPKKAKITVKLASIAPENTDWGRALNRMAKEWRDASNGDVDLVVYHGGIAGSKESDVLRKLKGNQIQAAVFTSIGLSLIAPEVMTLSIPFLIRNDRELNGVLNAVKPDLERKIDSQGYFVLAWAKSGWIKIFSKEPVFVPGDLKRLKVGTSSDTPEMNQSFAAMGYRLVPVDLNNAVVSLKSGMVDAVYQSSVSAAGFQLFGAANNMMDFNIAPFMGGIVMTQKAWQSIPDEYKPKLLASIKNIEKDIDDAITKLEAAAVNAMVSNGLKVNSVTPAQESAWIEDMDKAIPPLLDSKTFDRELYNKINTLVKNYRK